MKLTDSIGVVTCLIEMCFVPVETNRAIQLLLTVVEPIKAKTGCQACWISRDAVGPEKVRYSEVWISDPAFRAHVRSEEFRPVLAALDMCCEEPKVTIGELTGQTGMGYLRKLRGVSEPDEDPAA